MLKINLVIPLVIVILITTVLFAIPVETRESCPIKNIYSYKKIRNDEMIGPTSIPVVKPLPTTIPTSIPVPQSTTKETIIAEEKD